MKKLVQPIIVICLAFTLLALTIAAANPKIAEFYDDGYDLSLAAPLDVFDADIEQVNLDIDTDPNESIPYQLGFDGIIPYTLSNTMDDDGNNDESGGCDLSITLFTPNGNPYHPLIGAAVPNALDASVECSHDWSPWYPATTTCHRYCKTCGEPDNPGHHYDKYVSVNSSQHEISCIRCGYVYGNYAHIFTTTPMGNGVLKLTCTKCNHTEYVYAKK